MTSETEAEAEEQGRFYCRVTDKSPWWNRGLMTREEALAASEEVLGEFSSKENPNGGYTYVTVTTPSSDPPNKLPTRVLEGDKDGFIGPWAPTSEADPVIRRLLLMGAKSLKGIATALKSADNPGGRMTQPVLRSHLRRLGYRKLPKDKNHTGERWGK